MLVTRIIKSEHCAFCKTYLPRLQKQNYPFEIYDGDDPNNSAELDAWLIDQFPVVQIIERQTDGTVKVLHQFPPGSLAPRHIEYKKQEIEKRRQKLEQRKI